MNYSIRYLPNALVCLLIMHKDRFKRKNDDLKIKHETIIFDIPYILLNALFHLPQMFRLTTRARDLRPTCNSRFSPMANHIFVHQLRIFLGMLEHVRARPYNRHFAAQHVDELRCFIKVTTTKKIAKRELTRVMLGCLKSVCLIIDVHGAELVARKFLATYARSLLLEKHRSGTRQLDAYSAEYENEREYRT